MKILVTGALGFVGQALCAAAAFEGVDVRPVVRRRGLVRGSDAAISEIGPETDWEHALRDVAVVIHLAARVHVMHELEADSLGAFRRVNTQGTERLAEAAAKAGVRRFIFVSTVKVHGEFSSEDDPFRPDSPLKPADSYARSKAEAEESLRELEARTGIEVVIIRPPLVYGPRVKANFFNLMRVIDGGLPLPVGSVQNQRSLLYVGNLTDLLLRVATAEVAAGKDFLVADGPSVSTPGLVRALARALDRPVRMVPVPALVLRAVGTVTRRRAALDRLLGSLVVDDTSTRTELGWQPPHGMQEGLDLTAEWFHRVRSNPR